MQFKRMQNSIRWMTLCVMVGWVAGCQSPSAGFDGSTSRGTADSEGSSGRVFRTVTDDGTEEVQVEPADDDDSPAPRSRSRRSARSTDAKATADEAISDAPSLPAVRAATGPSARVQQVNERLQFSVLDFGVDNIPGATNHMGVYREGKQIGIVRLGSIVRGSTVVADIVSGEIKAGDTVRGIIPQEDLPSAE